MVRWDGRLAIRVLYGKLLYKRAIRQYSRTIVTGLYFLPIAEIKNDIFQDWCSTYCEKLHFRLKGHDSTVYFFDLHCKDENGSLSSFGRAVLLKFDTLHSLDIYI